MKHVLTRAILALLILQGCSTAPLSLKPSVSAVVRPADRSCNGIDWWEAGRTDGVSGVELNEALTDLRERCEGQTIDQDAFENGHEVGRNERREMPSEQADANVVSEQKRL